MIEVITTEWLARRLPGTFVDSFRKRYGNGASVDELSQLKRPFAGPRVADDLADVCAVLEKALPQTMQSKLTRYYPWSYTFAELPLPRLREALRQLAAKVSTKA